jgi:hypothetical protein
MPKNRARLFLIGAAVIAIGGGTYLGLGGVPAPAVAASVVEVWKSESCGCCGGWVDHMRAAGFTVKVHEVDDMQPVKRARGVPEALGSCHTSVVDGYVIEGHVPADDVRRLLAERPVAIGLTAPGMPQDAPGMDMKTGQRYEVLVFGKDETAVFARH